MRWDKVPDMHFSVFKAVSQEPGALQQDHI